MIEEQATQLADIRPYLDNPLRVSIPTNVPERKLAASRDKGIYEDAYAPTAIATDINQGKALLKASNTLYRNLVDLEQVFDYSLPQQSMNLQFRKKISANEQEANLRNILKDYTVLAYSSKRANKRDVEASAYASLGVVYDNEEEYETAIEFYEKYLSLSEELGDNMGITAACNCIGVNYMVLANPTNEPGTIFAQSIQRAQILLNKNQQQSLSLTSTTTANPDTNETGKKSKSGINHVLDCIHKAIDFHTRHLEIGPDMGGKLVAHLNLGVCYTWLQEINRAARHYQDALRIAIKMQTLYGQAIAVGNLGLLALAKNDFHTSRTCFEQVVLMYIYIYIYLFFLTNLVILSS
jgi:tetratricopeptide (TPR) repeat protein